MSVRQRKNDDKAVDSVPVPSHINDTFVFNCFLIIFRNGSTLDSTTAASLSVCFIYCSFILSRSIKIRITATLHQN